MCLDGFGGETTTAGAVLFAGGMPRSLHGLVHLLCLYSVEEEENLNGDLSTTAPSVTHCPQGFDLFWDVWITPCWASQFTCLEDHGLLVHTSEQIRPQRRLCDWEL